MATPRSKPQTIAFIPPGVEQSVGTRSLPLGRLVEATNVRQIKKGEWRKRPGFARTIPTDDVGVYSGGGVNMQSVYAGALVERDAVGQFWAYNSAGTIRRRMGIAPAGLTGARPFPTYQDAGIDQAPNPPIVVGGTVTEFGNRRSVMVLGANSDKWVFTVGDGQFQYAVTGADGSIKKPATVQTSTTAYQLAAAYHPGQSRIYVLVTDGTSLVTTYSFNTSTYVLAGSAAYAAGVTGLTGVDVAYLSSPGEVAVVIMSYDTGTPRCRARHSYLDPATLAPKGAPAAVNVDVTPHANRPDFCGGGTILISSGATSWYYAFWRAAAASLTLELVLVQVTTSTLAAAATTQLATVAVSAAGDDWRAVASGWVDLGSGNREVLAQTYGPTTRFSDCDVRRYTWNGSVVTNTLVAAGATLASKPALLNSAWYFLTIRDTGYPILGSGSTVSKYNVRRGEMYLRSSSGAVLAQMFEGGDGPHMWHRALAPDQTSTPNIDIAISDAFVTTLVSPAANTLACAVGRSGDQFWHQQTTVVTMDFAAAYGSPVALGGLAIFPGPVVCAAGPGDNLAELFPLHPPPVPVVALGNAGVTGATQVCVTYRIVRSDGRIWETAPSQPFEGTLFYNNTVTVQTVKHLYSTSAQIQLCVYAPLLGSTILLLQQVKRNDPTVNSVNMQAWSLEPDEPYSSTALHTNGGGLSHAQPPPSRSLTLWRDRLHLSGTPTEGEVWSSQELVEGEGANFSEFLRSNWNDGQGAILGLKPVDHNYLAAFKRNGIAVASGPGPDGRGGNPYTWQTLTTEKGLSDAALASPVSTPFGCEFQNEADGRWCVVGTDLQVRDIMQGADSHRTKTVACALLVESERQVWVFCTDGTLLVRGYAFPDAERPLGDWWKWSSTGLRRAYGAVITPTGPLHINVDGALQSPAAATWRDTGDGGTLYAIDTAIETGRLAPFGLLMEGGVVGTHLIGEVVSAGLGDILAQVTVTPDDALVGSDHEIFIADGDDYDFSMKPTGCFRCKEVRVRVEEFATGNLEGCIFVGVALDVVPYGRTRILPVGQRIA